MLIRKLRSLRVEYALEELLNVDIRSTFSKPTSIEKKYIYKFLFGIETEPQQHSTNFGVRAHKQPTQNSFSLSFSSKTQCFSIMYENFTFLVPYFAVFLPHFHIEFFFYFSSYTMPLLQNAQGGKEEKKMRKSTLAIYIEWLELSFMMSMKAGMRRNQENQEGKKYKYISIFFADTRFFFLHCCCCSSSIRNQNIYQQWNENGMDRWLQINENKNILVLVYDMQVP